LGGGQSCGHLQHAGCSGFALSPKEHLSLIP